MALRGTGKVVAGAVATLALAVAPPDAVRASGAPPRCIGNTAEVPQGGSVVATIPCTDPEGDPLTYRFVFQSPGRGGGPSDQGTVQFLSAGPPATFRFTPVPSFAGRVTVGFIANDGTSDSNQSITDITVTPVPPTPQPGKTAQAKVVSGKVLVRAPGSPTFQTVTGTAPIRVGSVLDLTQGRIKLAAAGPARRPGAASRTQSADFYGGIAVFTQDRRSGLTTLALTRDFSSCPRGKQGSRRFAAARRRRGNRLWGSGKGRFRTRGRYAAATVRGTTWLVADTCAGTLTQVKAGSVEVRDFVKRRTITLHAGGRYLAKRR